MTKNTNIPKLRFSEFNYEWDEVKLGEITKWTSGGTPPKDNPIYWNGHIPWISASSMRGYYYSDSELKLTELGLKKGSKLASKGSLLMLVRGSMLYNKIPIGIAEKDLAFNQDVKSIEVNEMSFSLFLLYWFNSIEPNLLDMVTGTGIGAGKLDLGELRNLVICLPKLSEQTKIASFLTAVDDKLQVLKKKKELLEQYKKGMMQQLFSQEIRFKKDDGTNYPDWEEKKLGNCLDYTQPTSYLVESTEYDNSYSTPVVTAGKTFILGYTNEEFGIYENGLPVIIFDDFTTASQFVDFPFKAKSSAMKILTAKESMNIKFVYEAMQMINFEIGGHGRHWISIYSELMIEVPCEEEQTKIANFLSVIDDKIAHCQLELDGLEQWKKGLLQQLFC